MIEQKRILATSIPGPASQALQARKTAAVSAGVSTGLPVYVTEGAGGIVRDADGNQLIDFGSGIAVTTVGNGNQRVIDAVTEQIAAFTHTCFMVTPYDKYVQVCEKLNELTPGDHEKRSALFNSGAEAVENAVKIARTATGRPGVLVFDRAFHGRTNLTMAMTSKLVYKQGFGPFAPEVYRAPAPYPYRGVSVEDALAGLELLFKQDVSPAAVACLVLETVQGEGGFIPMPAEFIRALKELCAEHGIVYVADEVQSGCGRTGSMWAIEHAGVEPDLIVSGKTLGGGLPLAAVTGRSQLMDAPHPGGLGGTFGGNPVSCAAACAVLDQLAEPAFRERAEEVGSLLRTRLDELASHHEDIGEVRGLGAMLAIELAERSPDRAREITVAAREQGLLLLSCGLYGNVIRLLPPVTATDEELDRGLSILERSLGSNG